MKEKHELTGREVVRICRAAVLMAGYSAALSEHEQSVVETVVKRFRTHGQEIHVTANEWPVIEAAIGAMEAMRHDQESDRKVA